MYVVKARINSLGGAVADVQVISIDTSNAQTVYIVDYNSIKCTAILNPFNGCYYVDDVYGRVDV